MKIPLILIIMQLMKLSLIMISMMILSIPLFNFSIHPVNYMLNFMMFTFSMILYLYINTNKSLYSMMIMISIIGGVMIMFNYFLSLINNEKSKMNFLNFWFLILFSMIMIYFMIMMMIYYNNYINLDYLNSSFLKINNINIFKIYQYPMMYLTVMMMLLLLICLILSFKMCMNKFMPLRKLNQ